MPPWLKILLLAVGLLIAVTFLAELVRAARRRRQPATRPGTPGAGETHIVLADHDRLIVTRSQPDDMVYVLRPPGTDPKAILRAARLVLPEHLYRELAAQLEMPASWPIILADHDRLVVTCSARDGTVYVLRPPGQDPWAILRAARLVLPECSYGELADYLGVPADWPTEHEPGAPASWALE